jgi:vancomycin resistance protein YoaR
MTTTTPELTPNAIPEPVIPLPAGERPSPRIPFLAAFAVTLAAILVLGAGLLYAYERQFDGRILPGVHVGSVDLSGLTVAEAAARVDASYASVANGELVLTGGARGESVSYAALGRHVDTDSLVSDALAVGRSGSALDDLVGYAKAALRGVVVAPRVIINDAKLTAAIQAAARPLEQEPVNATVTATADGFATTPSASGQAVDVTTAFGRATAALSSLDAPSRTEVAIPVVERAPTFTTDEATAAATAAGVIAADVQVTDGAKSWTIKAATIRTWLRIAPTTDGAYAPVVDIDSAKTGLAPIASKILEPAVDATFLISKNGATFGVTAAKDGRALDVDTTAQLVADALMARTSNVETPSVAAAIVVTKPKLSTEEAQQAAPLMKRISTWTTYFPISERNHFGANIWLPAQFINGTVVPPGGTFDFWRSVGPITTARGFGKGGAIINGQTDPQGAIGGGICSCSTTLFNAALRAGMQMHARRNHFYYIDRYPLGLDATVFISSSGSKQTMSFTNDTPYPVLIRGIRTRSGSRGYVRFDLYSVPNGRTVVVGAPTVRNISRAWDSTVKTASMPAGTSKRIESPVDGKDVWRTISVYQDGKLIRQHTYYSHYARITGVVLVGTG